MVEYTKTVWSDGDIITAEKMNKIENGIAEASGGSNSDLVFSVEIDSSDPQNMTLITPFEDCLAAVQAGKKLSVLLPDGAGGKMLRTLNFVVAPDYGSYTVLRSVETGFWSSGSFIVLNTEILNSGEVQMSSATVTRAEYNSQK